MKPINRISGWYLLYTKPHHEKKIQARLSQLNIQSFLPTRKTIKRYRTRRKYVDEVLFPCYVFIYLIDKNNYFRVLEVDGCLYCVRNGPEISRVDDSVIDNLKLATFGENDIEVSGKRFQPGVKVVITEGLLAGLFCEVVKDENKKKLLVRIDLLKRNLLLTVNKNYLAVE